MQSARRGAAWRERGIVSQFDADGAMTVKELVEMAA